MQSPHDFVVSERQWKRQDRIAFARMMLLEGETPEFWQAVLSLYGVRHYVKRQA